MKLNTFLFVVLFLFVISCSVTDTDSTQNKIVGEWMWLYSTGGFIGETLTPDSVGVSSRQLHFYDHNLFSFYRADTLVAKGTYSLNHKNDDLIISYETNSSHKLHDQFVNFTGSDTLTLLDECYDCYLNAYVRIK